MARGLASGFDGRRLRKARSAVGEGLSAAALAALIGASKEEILLYEAGLRRPEAPRIRRLAEALEIDPIALADPESMPYWTLADLRRLNGYRLRDLSEELHLSLRAYGRVEREGLFPLQRFGLLGELARKLGLNATDIEGIIARSPEVQNRLTRTESVLRSLIRTYTKAGQLHAPSSSDRDIATVASLYGRPPWMLAALIAEEAKILRALLRRQASHQASADFAATADERAEAMRGIQAQQARREHITSTLAQRLDSFFRCTLPAEHWRALAHLNSVAGNLGVPLTPAQLMTADETLVTMPGHLVETLPDRAQGSGVKYAISEDGIKHHAQYRAWYDALYPQVRAQLQVRGVPANGHIPLPELKRRFSEIDAVLLSFDGLLCRLWTTDRSAIHQELSKAAQSLHLGLDSPTSTDPVGMLRAFVRNGTPAKLRRIDDLLTTFEVKAARKAQPLPGVSQFLRIVTEHNWSAAIVTDHAADAVQTFLTYLDHAIVPERFGVFGRPVDFRRMKPHPHTVSVAVKTLQARHSRTVLLGESVADFLAARAAGIEFIGVASSAHQLRLLRQAGVTGTVSSMQSLTRALASL